MKKFYDQLPPSKKKYVNYGLIATLVIVLYQLVAPEQEKTQRKGPDTIKSIFNTGNDRVVSLDAMGARIKLTEADNETMRRKLERTELELEKIKDATGVSTDTKRQLATMRAKQERLEQALQSSTEALSKLNKEVRNGVHAQMPPPPEDAISEEGAVVGNPNVSPTQNAPSNKSPMRGRRQSAQEIFQVAGLPSTTTTTVDAEGNEIVTASKLEITTITQAGKDVAPSEDDSNPDGEESFYLPMGSILSGVLLNGLDAPTGVGANRDPFPVVLRLQSEAILPNNFSADVIDCHAIMSGYGDLSMERVVLRAEGIACVREDGRTIEASMEGYAAGTDGKAGLRGRLVTKQSQLVARSLMAGMASGFSNAFSSTPIPVVNTGNSDTINYADTLNSNTLTNGLVGGTQTALDRAAEWFLEFADAMTPVLEVDAAREVDVVLTKGLRLVVK